MPAAQTTWDIFVIILGLMGMALLIAIFIVVIWWIFGRGKQLKDTWKEMFKKMKEDSKRNMPDNLVYLHRIAFPAPNEFLGKIEVKRDKEGKIIKDTTKEILEKLHDTLDGQHTASVFLGNIVGFNRIDLLLTIEDMIVPTGKYENVLEEISKEQIKEVEKVIEKCGQYINVITYIPKKRKLLSLDQEEVLLAWDDQLAGLHNREGNLYVYGQGTDTLAIYFSIVSGFRDRVKAIQTYLIARGWILWATRLAAIQIETTEDAMRLDTTSQKIMSFLIAAGASGRREGDKKL